MSLSRIRLTLSRWLMPRSIRANINLSPELVRWALTSTPGPHTNPKINSANDYGNASIDITFIKVGSKDEWLRNIEWMKEIVEKWDEC